MLLIQKKYDRPTILYGVNLWLKPISATAARMESPSVGLLLLFWDYPTRGYRSCVKGQGVSALHGIAKPKCTTVWGLSFTLNNEPR